MSPGNQAPPLVCAAIGPIGWQTLLPWYDWEEYVTEILRNDNLLLVGHNIAFDMADIAAEAPHLFPLIFDAYDADRIACTQVRQKLCDIAGGVYRSFDDIEGETQKIFYGLGDLALRHLGWKLDKVDFDAECVHVLNPAKPWKCLGCNVPMYGHFRRDNIRIEKWPEGARQYPLDDIRAALLVFEKQDTNAMYLEDQFRQTRGAFWLRLMMNWGIRTDAEGVVALADKTQRSYDGIAEDLRKVGLLRDKKVTHHRDGTISEKEPRNMKAAQDMLVIAYEQMGKPIPMTDGGKSGIKKPSTGKLACQESQNPTLIKFAELTSLKTVLSKDVPLLEAGIYYPIHSYFEEMLESGRTSSKKPNIQNLRRLPGIRECFAPNCLRCGTVHGAYDIAAGKCLICGSVLTVFVGSDFGGLELCTLAEACFTLFNYSLLGDALNADRDPHLILAGQMRKQPYDVLYAVRKKKTSKLILDPSGKYCWFDNQWILLPTVDQVDDARQTGKVGNFGFSSGLGPDALVFFALSTYNVRLTRDEAQELKTTWLGTWLEMKEFFAWINSHTRRSFPQIKQLLSNRYRGGVSFTEACNTIFQGMGADIAKAAGWLIAKACYVEINSPLYGCRIVNFIHDEYVLLCPETRAHEAAIELRRLMLLAAEPWLRRVKIDATPVVMRRYSNDAEQVWQDGRLVPWEPIANAA